MRYSFFTRGSFLLLFYHLNLLSLNAQSTAFNPVQEEVWKVIQAETAYFAEHSMAEVVQQFWILDDKTLAIIKLADGTVYNWNKTDLLSQTSPSPEGYNKFEKFNVTIEVNNGIAIVTHDQVIHPPNGKPVYMQELRWLEKVDNTWKVHTSVVHQFVK